MMHFGFQTATEIGFGRGVSARAIDALVGRAARVLVVHGSRRSAASWLIEAPTAKGIAVVTMGCASEPQLDDVMAATDLARSEHCDAVVALGGGSVIDLGKAVSGLATASGPPLDYLEVVGAGKPLDQDPLYFVAIPTTAGTGAEVTKNAVVGVPEHKRKVSLRSAKLFPDLALIDPALTDGAPLSVTMGSGLDAVTQVVEAFVSSKATALTDALCLDALPRGLPALRMLAESEDPGARDAMAYTSLIGGLALANAGLGAVHGLAGVIGGRTGAPHGEICGTLLPFAIEENLRLAPATSVAADKLATVRSIIADAFDTTEEEACAKLVGWMRSLGVRDIGALGVRADEVEDFAGLAVGGSSSKGNPTPLTQQDFARLLNNALAERP